MHKPTKDISKRGLRSWVYWNYLPLWNQAVKLEEVALFKMFKFQENITGHTKTNTEKHG